MTSKFRTKSLLKINWSNLLGSRRQGRSSRDALHPVTARFRRPLSQIIGTLVGRGLLDVHRCEIPPIKFHVGPSANGLDTSYRAGVHQALY